MDFGEGPHQTYTDEIIWVWFSGQVTALDQIPKGISPAFAIWAPGDTGIVFVGLDDEPFRLGRVACNNRRYSFFLLYLIFQSFSQYNREIGHAFFNMKKSVSGIAHQRCSSTVENSRKTTDFRAGESGIMRSELKIKSGKGRAFHCSRLHCQRTAVF